MKTAGCLALTLVLSVPAYAKTSTAERFDAVVRVQPGGTLDVTETLVMRFESGTFKELTRQLAGRRNDGVAVLEVWMDGRRIAIGDGPGQARIDGSSRTRLRWRFPPTSSSTHTFGVRYLVAGAVAQDARGDMLIWRAPLGEHPWRIESSTVEYELPAGVTGRAAVDTRRAATATTAASAGGARVIARDLRSNGWSETTLVMPTGSILGAPPAWQQSERQRAAYSTAWLGAATVVLVAGLIPLFALRQGFDGPPGDLAPTVSTGVVPDSLPPALAGAIVARGRASLEHAAATLFALAERGEIRVDEHKRGTFGTRTYQLTRAASRRALASYEEAALEAAFAGAGDTTLAKARARLVRRFRRFTRALNAEMEAHGLVDRDRQATRKAYLKTAGALFVLAALTFMAWPFTMQTYGAWPLAVPAALTSAAIIALILYGTSTPLSNEGAQRARNWSAYKDHLESVAKQTGGLPVASAALPYAIALGLAGEWSEQLKAHPIQAPHWFRSDGDESAYAAFVAAAGAGPPQTAH